MQDRRQAALALQGNLLAQAPRLEQRTVDESKGVGLFVGRDVEVGELLVSEQPLFTVPGYNELPDHPAQDKAVRRAVKSLSEKDRQSFRQLKNSLEDRFPKVTGDLPDQLPAARVWLQLDGNLPEGLAHQSQLRRQLPPLLE